MFGMSAATLATIKLIALGVIAALILGYVGNVFYKANKLDKIEQRDAQTGKALKPMVAQAKKEAKREAAHFAKIEEKSGQLQKDLQRENAKFDDARRAEYFSVLNDALRGAQ